MKIKFLCLNLWEGGFLMEDILEFIKKENPDILALQEVYNGHDVKWSPEFRSIDILQAKLDYKYHHFAPAFLEKRDIGLLEQGNAVFSRFPIKSSKVTFYDRPYAKNFVKVFEAFPDVPRNLQHVVLDLGGRELNIFNTQGIWGGRDGGDNERRFNMSDIIVSQIKDKTNVILAGDFNLQNTTQAIGNIEKYLINIFKGKVNTTFNMKRKINPNVKRQTKYFNPAGYSEAIVDMIFTSPNIKVFDYSCPQVDISDHFPLLVNLEI